MQAHAFLSLQCKSGDKLSPMSSSSEIMCEQVIHHALFMLLISKLFPVTHLTSMMTVDILQLLLDWSSSVVSGFASYLIIFNIGCLIVACVVTTMSAHGCHDEWCPGTRSECHFNAGQQACSMQWAYMQLLTRNFTQSASVLKHCCMAITTWQNDHIDLYPRLSSRLCKRDVWSDEQSKNHVAVIVISDARTFPACEWESSIVLGPCFRCFRVFWQPWLSMSLGPGWTWKSLPWTLS